MSGGRGFRLYKTADGRQVVKAELLDLPAAAQGALVDLMRRKERGECFANEDRDLKDWPLRELRLNLDGNAYRLLYGTVAPNKEILLGVAIVTKKSPKLPKSTLEAAQKRLRDWEERGEETRRQRERTGAPSGRQRARKKPR